MYPVARKTQIITSEYGKRPGFKRSHAGVDLRSYDDSFTRKLPIVLPENCIYSHSAFQKKWGWTHVFHAPYSGHEFLKFTHMIGNDKLIPGKVYTQGFTIGFTDITKYMIDNGYGEHLHFETWPTEDRHENPILFFNYHFLGTIDWDFSGRLKERGFKREDWT